MIPSDNTAVSCVEIEGEQAKVLFYGDGSHLTPELSTLGKQTWWREPKEKAAIEDQNIWYRPWEPVEERALYESYRRLGSASTVTSLVPWSSSIRRRRRPVKRTPKRSWWP